MRTQEIKRDITLQETKIHGPKFSSAEIARHNTRTDCWLIIDRTVYDVTPYVEDHPGGDAILRRAGLDNTKGFYGSQHPSFVHHEIKRYAIGTIAD
mmetsp:Transcript_13727/g.18887  ORF Transcript_13727/g.18887 Transcript_13727/m.18887 type:complete len:96 (+) Transcript_13727:144-431(+)